MLGGWGMVKVQSSSGSKDPGPVPSKALTITYPIPLSFHTWNNQKDASRWVALFGFGAGFALL